MALQTIHDYFITLEAEARPALQIDCFCFHNDYIFKDLTMT